MDGVKVELPEGARKQLVSMDAQIKTFIEGIRLGMGVPAHWKFTGTAFVAPEKKEEPECQEMPE